VRKLWRFLPAIFVLLLAIGGAILVQQLAVHYLDINQERLKGVETVSPCEVDEIWSSWSTLFQVNIRTGSLSFTTAKIIDIAFDLVVGRGGQACLAWIVYRVYTVTLTRMTENGQVKLDLFAAITLRPNQVNTLGITFKSVLSTENLRSKCLLIWILVAMAYVGVFPTLVSAATSLVGATTVAVQLPNNGTAPVLAYIAGASYSLADTGLLNKPNPWVVSVEDVSAMSDWGCNIAYWSHHRHSGMKGTDIIINGTEYTLSNSSHVTCGFNYAGTFYQQNCIPHESPQAAINRQTICLPDGHSYQWGASWELILLITILQITWSLSVLIVWTKVTKSSKLVPRSRKLGMWRAVLDLAAPLLLELGPDNGMYDEKELERTIRDMPPVHFEAKVEEAVVEEGYPRAIYLVSK